MLEKIYGWKEYGLDKHKPPTCHLYHNNSYWYIMAIPSIFRK